MKKMMKSSDKLVVNELLFFISNKIHITTKDNIVGKCVKFYSVEEINAAISVLESSSDVRVPKRNKGDASKMIFDVYDKLFTLDSTAAKSPLTSVRCC